MRALVYILAFLISLTPVHNTELISKGRIRLFENKIDKLRSNYIEFSESKESIEGVFYGVELTMDNKPVYYKSKLGSLRWHGENIYFTLKDYAYSLEPFFQHNPKNLLNPNDKQLPGIALFQTIFSGTIFTDTLQLARSAIYYDGHFDAMIFVKVANSGAHQGHRLHPILGRGQRKRTAHRRLLSATGHAASRRS